MTKPTVPSRDDILRLGSARQPWVAPELRTLVAGSAEAGPNPNAPEGAFARGS
jgi:hypothetical protein